MFENKSRPNKKGPIPHIVGNTCISDCKPIDLIFTLVTRCRKSALRAQGRCTCRHATAKSLGSVIENVSSKIINRILDWDSHKSFNLNAMCVACDKYSNQYCDAHFSIIFLPSIDIRHRNEDND